MMIMLIFFFFFQAEDGIRDTSVTGVQTCALPIYRLCMQTKHFAEFLEGAELPPLPRRALLHGHCHHKATGGIDPEQKLLRSEERRVGKEGRARWARYQ